MNCQDIIPQRPSSLQLNTSTIQYVQVPTIPTRNKNRYVIFICFSFCVKSLIWGIFFSRF